MQIDDSLANALKNNFFKELTTNTKSNLKKVSSQSRGKRSRNGFVKYAKTALKNFSITSVYQYEGGSASAPYFAFDSLLAIPDRELNSWSEKCLSALTVVLMYESTEPLLSRATYNVGEHLIARMIQRSGLVQDPLRLDSSKLISELAYVPMWANFWLLASVFSDDYEFGEELTIPIPARRGLLLGHLNSVTRLIELRTYVDDSKLSDSQKIIRDMMLSISKQFMSSPVCFALAQAMVPYKAAHNSLMMMLGGLVLNGKYSDILFNYMTERYQDQVRPSIKKRLVHSMKELCLGASPELYGLLVTHGMRTYLSQMQGSMLRLRYTYQS